jgi:hypothetical protein
VVLLDDLHRGMQRVAALPVERRGGAGRRNSWWRRPNSPLSR